MWLSAALAEFDSPGRHMEAVKIELLLDPDEALAVAVALAKYADLTTEMLRSNPGTATGVREYIERQLVLCAQVLKALDRHGVRDRARLEAKDNADLRSV